MENISADKMVVIDLYAGRYNIEHIGHERYNFDKNDDGFFYGYCPPWDGININKLGARRNADYIDNILVVYVAKKENSSDRKIIGFCLNARVFRKGQSGADLRRTFRDNDGKDITASYSIKSDNLFNLNTYIPQFEIKISDYNVYMFRKQRFYGGKFIDLDVKIIAYINSVLNSKETLDNDDGAEQEEILKAKPTSSEDIHKSADKPLNVVAGSIGKLIAKDSRISKSALVAANYKCIIDPSHKTFVTKYNIPYMEGHHLIPCTVTNSEHYFHKFNKNIDCFENIVCVCPNCHRELHYGEWNSKAEKIKTMFKKQQKNLESVGLIITEDELLNLYQY